MDDVLRGLDFCFTYLDNIRTPFLLVSWGARATSTGYHRLMSEIRDPHQSGKLHLPSTRGTFLGYKVSTEGSQPLEEWVTHLHNCQPPKMARQLLRSLGMLNFYRRFLPHAAAIHSPLHVVPSGPRVKDPHHITLMPELHSLGSICC
jgi:hypothetical protein